MRKYITPLEPQHNLLPPEGLEGDEDRPGPSHLGSGVDPAGLHDGQLSLDADVGLDQRRDLVGQSETSRE